MDDYRRTRRVLVMDDQESLRTLGCAVLRALGCACHAVPDGESAVREYAQAMASGARYDAILMDLSVPDGMGGAEAMRRILRIDPGAVGIICSGQQDEVTEDPAAHGFAAIVRKPYLLADIASALSDTLEAGTARREPGAV